jgi:hypothetical protein
MKRPRRSEYTKASFRLFKQLDQYEQHRRQRLADELMRFKPGQSPGFFWEAARLADLVAEIRQDGNFPEKVKKHAQRLQRLALASQIFEGERYSHFSEGNELHHDELRAWAGDDEALIRLISWHPLFLFTERMRNRVADARRDGDTGLLKRIGRAFTANRRFKTKEKKRKYMALFEGALLHLKYRGAFEGPLSARRDARNALKEDTCAMSEEWRREAEGLAAQGKTKTAASLREKAELL